MDGAHKTTCDIEWGQSRRKRSADFRKNHAELNDFEFGEHIKNISV